MYLSGTLAGTSLTGVSRWTAVLVIIAANSVWHRTAAPRSAGQPATGVTTGAIMGGVTLHGPSADVKCQGLSGPS